MQGKGLIKFFLIALSVVCVWQYLLMIPTNRAEAKADAYSKAMAASANEADRSAVEKIARTRYLDSISSETIFSIPLLKKFTYQELKAGQLNLGLDLKGGMSVLLQVDLKDFLNSLSNKSKDPAFLSALENAEKRLKSEQKDFVTLFAEEFAKVSNGRKLSTIFARNEGLKDQINLESSDAQVLSVIRKKADQTVSLTFQRLKDRIDKFGVTQPNVSLDAARDMIVVELPGIDNPERARKMLQAAAKLEFWETYRVTDNGVANSFVEADAKLKRLQAGDTSLVAKVDSVWQYNKDSLGVVKDSFKVAANMDGANNAGPLLSSLNLNNPNQLSASASVLGTADKSKLNYIMEMLRRPELKTFFPADMQFRWSTKPMKDGKGGYTNYYELFGIKKTRGKDEAPLEGDRVISANANPDPQSGQIAVSLKMDTKGAKTWGELTTKAANDGNREIAIVLDSQVVSAPRVQNAILTGDSQITGDFTLQEGDDLAKILQVGKLPATTKIIQESLVGPSLGKENINKSLLSMILGFVAIMLIMVFYYSRAGIIAVIALLVNVFFILGVLTSMGTVLTLPGIAGLLLTMSIAVDADVIIYERIKEELRSGKSKVAAIADGFKGAYSAIIDGNLSNLLVSFVLAYYGLGPIKGFAVVLIVGIISSVFCAVLVCHLLIDMWMNKYKDISFSNKFSENFLTGIHYDWVGKRKYAYIFSALLIIAGIVSYLNRGFELGVDFKGGYSYNVQFDQPVNADQIRASLDKTLVGTTTIVKAIDTKNTFNITTPYMIDDQSQGTDEKVLNKVAEGLKVIVPSLSVDEFKKADGKGTHIISSTKVGAIVADDIKRSAFKSMGLALLLIFIYILIRFNKWQYSLGVVISLFHDVLCVMAIFSLFHGILPFSLEFDQALVAALLTIVGYSLNDTVVVFDRIREFIHNFKGQPRKIVINDAINNTLNRTVMTSAITFLTMLILFIFGGSSIKGFTFALLVGVFFGTYSSIFIATPIVVDLTKGGENAPLEGPATPVKVEKEEAVNA